MVVLDYIRQFNIYTVIIRLALALILGGAVGYDREKRGYAAGFRTHIIVCLGSALCVMTGVFITSQLNYISDPMRIGAQVISGIGFIGAGTIMVTKSRQIKGLTTAAGLWNTAAIGLAVGAGFYEGAVFCTLIVMCVISKIKSIDKLIFKRNPVIDIYFEISGENNVNLVLDKFCDNTIELDSIDVMHAKSGIAANIGFEASIICKRGDCKEDIVEMIKQFENLSFVIAL